MADRRLVIAALAELFRERGHIASSLPDITRATGLGKGSLYNLFPGGKRQMLAEVVASVREWFEEAVFAPLEGEEPDLGTMLDAVTAYFDSGRRLCLIGRIGLEPSEGELDEELAAYFLRWRASLAAALQRLGEEPGPASERAEAAVVAIQGALVVAHGTREPEVFRRTIARLRAELSGRRNGESGTSGAQPPGRPPRPGR